MEVRLNEENFYADSFEGCDEEAEGARAWREVARLDGIVDVLSGDQPLLANDLLRWMRLVEQTPCCAWGSGPNAEREIQEALGCIDAVRLKIRYAKRGAAASTEAE